jgi:hypothetical protein
MSRHVSGTFVDNWRESNLERRFMQSWDGQPTELAYFREALPAQQQLESLVRDDLRQSPYAELGRVKCIFKERVLTLSGAIPSYYLKQMAQRIALDRLSGTAVLINELRVEP